MYRDSASWPCTNDTIHVASVALKISWGRWFLHSCGNKLACQIRKTIMLLFPKVPSNSLQVILRQAKPQPTTNRILPRSMNLRSKAIWMECGVYFLDLYNNLSFSLAHFRTLFCTYVVFLPHFSIRYVRFPGLLHTSQLHFGFWKEFCVLRIVLMQL